MPREIKFRGKRTDDGEWVYGYYAHELDGTHNMLTDFDRSRCSYLSYVEVDIYTVGQYTGLKDKQGKEIYEGDIIKEDESIGIVAFYGCEFRIAWMINKGHFNNSLACHYNHV